MVPLYTYSMICLYDWSTKRLRTQTLPFLFIWTLCASLTLVLTPLLELRYFILPWVLLALEANGLKVDPERRIVRENLHLKWMWGLNLAWYTLVNAGVIYVFTDRPFWNPFFNEVSRFFW